MSTLTSTQKITSVAAAVTAALAGYTTSQAQLEEIAKTKLPDLNTNNLESAMRIVQGTANNMGITIQTD
jgi:large subunit ribosomal protein L11